MFGSIIIAPVIFELHFIFVSDTDFSTKLCTSGSIVVIISPSLPLSSMKFWVIFENISANVFT